MKIAILTLPLYSNYGGILQCYALQTVLQRLGNTVVVLTKPKFGYSYYIPEFGISDSRFSCYARFPTCAYYICPPNNMDGKMQNCKVQMKFTL